MQPYEEIRGRFEGIFSRVGRKRGKWKGLTILLLNMHKVDKTEHQFLTDHAWLNLTDGFKGLGNMDEGDVIRFDARVRKYRKGSIRRGIPVKYDFKFFYPTKVEMFEKSSNNEKMVVDFF